MWTILTLRPSGLQYIQKCTNFVIRGGGGDGFCVSQKLLNQELGCEFFVVITNARTTHADTHFPKQMLLGLERMLPLNEVNYSAVKLRFVLFFSKSKCQPIDLSSDEGTDVCLTNSRSAVRAQLE